MGTNTNLDIQYLYYSNQGLTSTQLTKAVYNTAQ